MLTQGQWDEFARDGYLHLGRCSTPTGWRALPARRRPRPRHGRQRAGDDAARHRRRLRGAARGRRPFAEAAPCSTARSRGSRRTTSSPPLVSIRCSSRSAPASTAARAGVDLPRDDHEQAGRTGHGAALAPGRRRRLGARPRPAGDDLGRARPGDRRPTAAWRSSPAPRLGLLTRRQHVSARMPPARPPERPSRSKWRRARRAAAQLADPSLGRQPVAEPRRAFTGCYMDGRTISTLTGALSDGPRGAAPEAEHLVVECCGTASRCARASRPARSTR